MNSQNIKCTCAKQTFLHLADCPTVKPKKLSIDYVYEQAINNPTYIIFYIVDNNKEVQKQLEYLRSRIHEKDWYFQQSAGSVASIMFTNGSEVTFLAEEEAKSLLELPESHRIYIEGSNASRDIGEMLLHKTRGISFVDPQTKELI